MALKIYSITTDYSLINFLLEQPNGKREQIIPRDGGQLCVLSIVLRAQFINILERRDTQTRKPPPLPPVRFKHTNY